MSERSPRVSVYAIRTPYYPLRGCRIIRHPDAGQYGTRVADALALPDRSIPHPDAVDCLIMVQYSASSR